jgi:ketosteroid isomerase-like protein
MMDIEAKRAAAIEFWLGACKGQVDPTMCAEDFTFWNPQMGTLAGDVFFAAASGSMDIFDGPLLIHVDDTTAENNRVAIEAHSEATLINGTRYANRYHMLIVFNDDGKIRRMDEHLDSQHMAETVSPLLAAETQS